MLSFLVFLAIASITAGQYTPPQATVLPLQPRGLRVSIPDEPGISLMAFHGKINEDFDSLEAGTMSRDIIKARNGRWTFEDRSIRLREGDTIYYWLHVVYDRLGYNLLDQSHRVTKFYNYDGTPARSENDNNNDVVAPCVTSITKLYRGKSGESPACSGQMIFEDNFNDLNVSIWERNEKFAGEPDSEFVYYLNDERNVKVDGGKLRVSPMITGNRYDEQFIRHGTLNLERCTGQPGTPECQQEAIGYHILPPVISGRVDTKNSFAFLYGRVEIRARLPRGDWIYPLLILESFGNTYGPGYESGQIRIACASGNTDLRSSRGTDLSGRVLKSGAVTSRSSSVRENTMSKKEDSTLWSNDFHTYGLEWRHDRIIVSVDGVVYGEKEYGASGTSGGNVLFNKPFYLTLGVAVGGRTEFPDNCTSTEYAKPWRNVESKALYNFFLAQERWSRTWNDDKSTLEVDYIKIWAL